MAGLSGRFPRLAVPIAATPAERARSENPAADGLPRENGKSDMAPGTGAKLQRRPMADIRNALASHSALMAKLCLTRAVV
jgi:hypothetical protein